MKVKCTKNDLKSIDLESIRNRLMRAIHLDGGDSDLELGTIYAVQAIEIRDGGLWYYLHSVVESDYPNPYPAEYFEVTDSKIEATWEVKIVLNEVESFIKRLTFKEWARDDTFFERLVDGDCNAVRLYRDNFVKAEDERQ